MKYRIKDICKQWANQMQRNAEEGINILYKLHGRLLSDNDIEPHTLNFDELCVFGSETTIRGISSNGLVIDLDHYLFWSWAAALLLGAMPDANGNPNRLKQDNDLNHLLRIVIKCIFSSLHANEQPPIFDRDKLEHNARVPAYLGFSLLEGISLKICEGYVNSSGIIIKNFSVNGEKYKSNERCSNLGILLSLAIKQTTNECLRAALTSILRHLAKTFNCNYGSSLLFQLRNEALHRGASHQIIGETLLSISLLLSLQFIEEQFDHNRYWVLVNCHMARMRPLPIRGFESDYAELSKTAILMPEAF